MHKLHVFAVLFAVVLMASCANLPLEKNADFVFTHVNVVPMNEEAVLENKRVAIRDGKIIDIYDAADTRRYNAARTVDLQGKFILPGLADMHVHVRWNPEAMFKLFLANGVTTVFNMGIADGGGKIDHVRLRADVAAGAMFGPRYLISGPQLHGDDLPDVDAVAPMLERHVEEQFDLVKVHGDLSPAVYDALIEGVRTRNLRISGHAQHLMSLSASLRMNALEHMEEFLYVSPEPAFAETAKDNFLEAYRAHVRRLSDPDLRARIVREVAASGIYVDPTFIIYRMVARWASSEHFADLAKDPYLDYLPAGVRNLWLNAGSNPYQDPDFPISAREIESNLKILSVLMRELHEADVPLLLGTDSFGTLVPGFSVHDELSLLVEVGLSPYQALRTGTVNVAHYLGSADSGTIEVGKQADFFLVGGNPLENIRRTRDVQGLFYRGKWYDSQALQALLDRAKVLNSQ